MHSYFLKKIFCAQWKPLTEYRYAPHLPKPTHDVGIARSHVRNGRNICVGAGSYRICAVAL